jgi:hypothetical protein
MLFEEIRDDAPYSRVEKSSLELRLQMAATTSRPDLSKKRA